MACMCCRAFFEGRYAELDAELFSRHREAFPRETFTLDAFLWAVATVRSRVHSPLDGDYVALVPLADLVRALSLPLSPMCQLLMMLRSSQTLLMLLEAPAQGQLSCLRPCSCP